MGGNVLFEGRDLLTLSDAEMRTIRGNQIAMIFQDPMTLLNPVLRIKKQLMEVIQRHSSVTKAQAKARAIELLEHVSIPGAADRIQNYAHPFSGGMRQRVMIADEPTTALDVTIQAQIVDLVKQLRAELAMSVIWSTHDLALLTGLADRILVMYAGQIVEQASLQEL